MPQGRWQETDDQLASEAFAVLIQGKPATRAYPKKELIAGLADPSIYTYFLKLCLESDHSKNLINFRKGLCHVIKSQNVSEIARKAGVTRMSLYRMLSKRGNPRFNNLIALLQVLKLRIWVVDEEFIYTEPRDARPKDQTKNKGPVQLSAAQRAWLASRRKQRK